MVGELLGDLMNRGLDFTEPRLYVLDGGKALQAAVKKYAGESAAIQRCQVHKRRNVLDHLTDEQKPAVAKKLNAAYAMEDYAAAKSARRPASGTDGSESERGAEFGRRYGGNADRASATCPEQLRKSLASTNVIESAFSIVEKVCRNVKRWHGGDQRERWVGSGLWSREKQFRRVRGYKQIPGLIRELETLNPSQAGSCQAEKGVVKWVMRESLLSTEIRAIPYPAGPAPEPSRSPATGPRLASVPGIAQGWRGTPHPASRAGSG